MSPEYKSPEVGTSLTVKFIRTERKIFIGDEEHPNHADIARVDKISYVIAELRKTNPTEIDAGWVTIKPEGTIVVSGDSYKLDLPVVQHYSKARDITKKDFSEQSPNHTVLGLRK